MYVRISVQRERHETIYIIQESVVRTLSYAPGPLDNEMQRSVRETLGDAEQKKLYTDMAVKVQCGKKGRPNQYSIQCFIRVNWCPWLIQLVNWSSYWKKTTFHLERISITMTVN